MMFSALGVYCKKDPLILAWVVVTTVFVGGALGVSMSSVQASSDGPVVVDGYCGLICLRPLQCKQKARAVRIMMLLNEQCSTCQCNPTCDDQEQPHKMGAAQLPMRG